MGGMEAWACEALLDVPELEVEAEGPPDAELALTPALLPGALFSLSWF